MPKYTTKNQAYGATPIPVSRRGIVSYNSDISSEGAIVAAHSLGDAGKAIEKKGQSLFKEREYQKAKEEKEKIKREREKLKADKEHDNLVLARLRTDMLKTKAFLKEDFRENDDYENYSERTDKAFASVLKQYEPQFVTNNAKEMAKTLFERDEIDFKSNVNKVVDSRHKEAINFDTTNKLNNILSLMETTKDSDEIAEMADVAHHLIDASAFNPVEKFKNQQVFKKSAAKSIMSNMDSTEALSLVSRALNESQDEKYLEVNKNDVIKYVLLGEGHKVVEEPNGGYSMFGVTTKQHPELAEKIKNGSLSLEEAAAVADNEYWSRTVGYPKNIQPLVFDFLYNGWDKKVLGKSYKEAVKEANGDANKLLDIRADYYDALYKSNPKKFGKYITGWKKRVEDLRSYTDHASVTNSPLDYLSRKEIKQIEKRKIAEEKDNIDVMSINELNAALVDGRYDILSNSQRRDIYNYSKSSLQVKQEKLLIDRLAVGVNNISELQSALEADTLTKEMMVKAEVENADDKYTLKAIDDIKKISGLYSDGLTNKVTVEKKADYNFDIGERFKALELETDKKTKKIVNSGQKESLTTLLSLRNDIYRGISSGYLSNTKGTFSKISKIDAAIEELRTAPQRKWFGFADSETGKALKDDPFFNIYSSLDALFVQKNNFIKNNNSLTSKLLMNGYKYATSIPNGLEGEDALHYVIEKSVQEVFPETVGYETYPASLKLSNGEILNLPNFMSGQHKTNLSIINIKNKYKLKKIKGTATKDVIKKLARARNIPEKEVVLFLRKAGEFADGE